MAGVLLLPVIGLAFGLLGRLVVPGRGGLVRLLLNDPRRAAKLLRSDEEIRWEVGAGVLGAMFGYIGGLVYDAQLPFGPSPMRWVLAAAGAALLVGIAIASGVIQRSGITRELGMHRRMLKIRVR